MRYAGFVVTSSDHTFYSSSCDLTTDVVKELHPHLTSTVHNRISEGLVKECYDDWDKFTSSIGVKFIRPNFTYFL